MSAKGDAGSVLILGATSGIGKAVARRWAMDKADLILAARDTAEAERTAADLRVRYGAKARVVEFDALKFKSFEQFANGYFTDGCQLAGVVLCYGFMADQIEAQKNPEAARKTIDTNFTSPMLLMEQFAAQFEKIRSGFICAVSSVAGDRGRQSNYIYGSSKAALDTYLEGLRVRLFKSDVHVVTVKPGFVDTAMTWGLPGLFLVAKPEKVADDMWKAVRHRRNKIYTPWFWRYIMLIIRSIPQVIFKRMKL
jgi:short-subunit dehydrogenase